MGAVASGETQAHTLGGVCGAGHGGMRQDCEPDDVGVGVSGKTNSMAPEQPSDLVAGWLAWAGTTKAPAGQECNGTQP